MDPVSTATAVLAFATAVKDIVELAQKVYESFAKVSKNRCKAKRTAENIKEMIDEIRVFCEAHKDTLANMKEFTAAIEGLLTKFRDFEVSILPLVAQRGRFLRAIVFLRGWWNNNRIEERISEVESDVVKIMRKYMMHGTMRLEVRQEVNHQDTTRRLEGLSQGLEVVRTDVSAIRINIPAIAAITPTTLGTSDERERNVMLFVRSAMSKSTSLLRPPDIVTDEMMTTVFIKSQIACIEAAVDRISTLSISGPSNTEPFSMKLVEADFMDVPSLRQTIVQDIMQLRNALSDSESLRVIPINCAIRQLAWISFNLKYLEMTGEAILLRNWAVKLARTLVNSSRGGETEERAALASHLYELANLHESSGNIPQGRQALEESLSIAENLLSQGCTDTEIQGLCVDILVAYAFYAPYTENPIARCMQAVLLLEGIFGIQTLARVGSHGVTGVVMDPSYDLVGHVFSLSPTPTVMILRCANAFQDLALYMLRAGKTHNANRLAHLCIALPRKMASVYGHANQLSLANTLSSICQGELAQCFTAGELLDLVNECALLFRQLTHKNPVRHSQNLLHLLWQKADILDRLNRNLDSISTLEEAGMLAGQIIQDFGLQADALLRLAVSLYNADMYLDAFRAMAPIPAELWDESHALLYECLSHDLLTLRHYKQSAEAANNSIAIYQTLALQRSEERWVRGTIRAYCALAQSLISLGNEAQGLHTLNEVMSSAGKSLALSSDLLPAELETYLQPFKTGLDVHNSIADNTRIHILEGLMRRYPQNKEIFAVFSDARASHAYHLYCLGQLQDALDYIKKWNENWATKIYLTSDLAWLPTRMVWIKTMILSAQGNLTQALSESHSHRLASGLCVCDVYVLISTNHGAQMDVALGDWQKGLEITLQALGHSRSHYPGDYQRRTTMALYGVAYTALHGQNYQQTMKVAAEGIDLDSDPEWVAKEDKDTISIRPSLFGIMSSAEANTGNVDRAMHYARQAVTLSLDIAEHRREISATTAKQSLMETRGYLAEVLLATGDLTQAREICEERMAYFRDRVKDRMGEHRDLAPILRMLGILYCNEGRHDEGEGAAHELTELIHRLGLIFPSLQEQVKIQLRYQASTPILHVLDEMTEQLKCEHQRGIVALFETELRTVFGPLCYHATSIF